MIEVFKYLDRYIFILVWVWVVMRVDRFTLLVMIVAVVIVVFFVVSFILTEVVDEPTECVDVSVAAGFVYDLCYDSYTQNVFMLVKGESDYYLNAFRVSFFDGRNRSYDLGYNVDDVSQLYKFYAAKNPSMIELDLNVFGVADSVCGGSRELSVRYCLTRRPGDGRGSLNGSEVEYYIPLPPQRRDVRSESTRLNSSHVKRTRMPSSA